MAATESTMLPLGTPAPDFSLPDPRNGNKIVSLSDLSDAKALVVVFMCNHCPFVKHIQGELAKIAKEYQSKGVAFVGISSNNVQTHPDDSPEKMAEEAKRAGYTFPYLYDESQEVAKAYKAACTPDFFVFDGDQKLFYRGQMDDTRPDSGRTPNGADLRGALDAVLAGEPAPSEQKPSMGCNIKWKPGKEPQYFKRGL